MKLNLETNSREQELVKAYLEENASETLAEKINNGTPFEKDGKTLINKKTLYGFMKYASSEARKLASKGANSACVEDKVVYGWAIHYCEEDSIEGTLFNADGTEYKPAPKPTPAQVRKVEAKKPEQRQATLFDFMETEKSEPEVNDENGDDEDEQPSQEEIDEILAEIAEEEKSDAEPEKPISHNAVTLSDELGLTLTGRDFGLTSRVPMIGFPYHAADNYLQKIIQKHKVAIAEKPDDVKLLPEPEDGFDASAFDKTAVVALVEIFGDKLSVR